MLSTVPTRGARFVLACQTVPDFRAPTWPDGPVPAQVHLDFYMDPVAAAVPAVLAAGALRHDHQPSRPDGRFVVSLDRVGHPFCLCEE